MQTFLERLKNIAFYYGSLLGEQWRALPLYIALGKRHNVDCLSTPVSTSLNTSRLSSSEPGK
jgi:hypothetical protein